MKKVILLAVFSVFIVSLFAQTDTSIVRPATVSIRADAGIQLSKDDYLKKSKHQRTAGTFLVSGGGGLFLVGGLVILSYSVSDAFSSSGSVIGSIFAGSLNYGDNTGVQGSGTSNTLSTKPAPTKHNNSFATGLLIIGIAAMLSSIPMFGAAAQNKKKAFSLSFKNEPIPQLQNIGGINAAPALTIALKF